MSGDDPVLVGDKVGMEEHDRSRRPSHDTEATGTSTETGPAEGRSGR